MRGRGRSRWNDYYPPYVSVAEKMAKAEAARKKLAASTRGLLEPIIIDGRAIAVTWWGKSWCANLERYADYDNRLPRGRSYVRNGAVLDLKIDAGRITAQVSGSRTKPYTVQIELTPLVSARAERLREQCRASLDSLSALLAGRFPDELREALFAQGSGLFPSPQELKFQCSCPDWASMCKHVAATLYGVGTRLDERPELFFTLRGLTMDGFVGEVVREESERLLARADRVSERVIATDDDEMAALFGITLEDAPAAQTETQAPRQKKRHASQAATGPEPQRAGQHGAVKKAAKVKGTAKATSRTKSSARIAPAPPIPDKKRRAATTGAPATQVPAPSATAAPPRKRGRPAKKAPPTGATTQAASQTPRQRLEGKRHDTSPELSSVTPASPPEETLLDEQLLAAFALARQRAAANSAAKSEHTTPPTRGRKPRVKK